jgi:hypothetical protein
MGVLTDARTQHLYQTCQDELCQRYACRVYKEGHRNGRELGRVEGYAKGHTDGYAEGFPDGLASCPGPHTDG